MDIQLTVLLLLVVLGLLARMLYWRVPADMVYIRDGLGKKRVLLTGGGVVIPGLHKLAGMHLGNFSLTVAAVRQQSLFTNDPLRVDIEVRLLARIKPLVESVLTAQKVFDGEVDNIRSVLEARCHAALSAIASEFSLDSLLTNPADFELRLNELLSAVLADLGLELLLCSVVDMKQTSQLDYQRSNCTDAKALAVLEAARMDTIKQVHTKFTATQLEMQQLDFDAAMRQLQWEEAFTAAKLEHQRHKAEIEARLTQEIKEIEVSKQLALEMIEHDVQTLRLQQEAA